MSEPSQKNLFTNIAGESISFVADSPVKTSRMRAKALGLTDHEADCGGRCCGWCAKCDLVGFSLRMWLLSEAEARTRLLVIWRRLATPAGRSWWVLTLLAQIIDGSGFGLWPTVTVCGNYNQAFASPQSGDGLITAVIKSWPTPNASLGSPDGGKGMKHNCSPTGMKADGTKTQVDLKMAVAMSWPTPSAMDGDRGAESAETKAVRGAGGVNLREAVSWPTPQAGDEKNLADHYSKHPPQLRHMKSVLAGPQAQDKSSTRGKPQGSLNSHWVGQLMGYPSDWCDLPIETLSKLSVTRSCLKSPK